MYFGPVLLVGLRFLFTEPAPPYIPPRTEFDFEEERLARAFSELSVERQKLLTLVFLYDLKPEEAAEVLHYSIKKF